jgi:hypothetical protein
VSKAGDFLNEADFDSDDLAMLKKRQQVGKDQDKQKLAGKFDDMINIMASDPGFNTPELKMKRAKEQHDYVVDGIGILVKNNQDTYKYCMDLVRKMKAGVPGEKVLNGFRQVAKIGAQRFTQGQIDWDDSDDPEPPIEINPAMLEDAAEELMQYYKREIEYGNYD